MPTTMKKITKLFVALAALLLTACGPATYDINNPEESTAKMLEDRTQDEKVQFGKALQKITLKQLQERNISLMEMIHLSKDPEKVQELLRCIDGKSFEEIIEMSK